MMNQKIPFIFWMLIFSIAQPWKTYSQGFPALTDNRNNTKIYNTRSFSSSGVGNMILGPNSNNEGPFTPLAGSYNINMGTVFTLQNLVNGNRNIALIDGARYLQNGNDNMAIGFPTLGTETGYKNRNIGITTYSLNAFSSGEDNIAIGSNSLAILENGSNNITFLGNFGQLITGTNNIGMGNTGFNYLINGQNNIGIGYSSFQHKPGLGTFSSNIGLGAYFIDYSFLKNNLSIPESGNYNIFIGNNVALRYEYGDNNILIGEFMGTQYSSLDLNNFGISTLDDGFKSGEGNIILGNRAFQNFNRGNNNIAIRDSVGHNLDGEGHLNNIIIGNKATFASTSCSNCLTIGNKIFGKYIYSDTLKLGFGQTNPTATLDINGVLYATSYSNSSDIRLKKNVEELEGAMAMVKELKPVSFHWKKSTGNPADKTNYGFIAQDIEKIDPNLVRTDEEGYKSVVYQEIIPILLQAAKELNEKLDELSR